jgi:hypothetical protein
MASVAYWPHVEHQMVSSDIHLVWGSPSSAAVAAAAKADCAAAPARQRWCAMLRHRDDDTRHKAQRQPCGAVTSA